MGMQRVFYLTFVVVVVAITEHWRFVTIFGFQVTLGKWRKQLPYCVTEQKIKPLKLLNKRPVAILSTSTVHI